MGALFFLEIPIPKVASCCCTDAVCAAQVGHSNSLSGNWSGFYKGTLPMLCGSIVFRSVPFTVYSGILAAFMPASRDAVSAVDS